MRGKFKVSKYIFAVVVILLGIVTQCRAADEDDALRFAIGAYNDGFYDVAEPGFAGFVKKYPYSKHRPYALYLLGVTRFMKNDFNGAKATLTELNDLYPKNERKASASYFLGESAYLTDDYKLARVSYHYVYKNPPDEISRSTVLYRVGELNFLAGDYKGAKAALSTYDWLLRGDRR